MAAKKAAPKSGKQDASMPAQFVTDADALTEVARDHYETAFRAFSDNAETFREQTEDALASTRSSFESANERLRAASADVMTAARDEVTEAVDFANNLARAKSFADALEIQREYWTKLFETRVERARAITEATVEATRDAFEPMSQSFGSAYAFAPAFEKFFPFRQK